MASDAQIPPDVHSQPAPRNAPLAPWWHTAIVVAVLLGASLNGTRSTHPLARNGKLTQYLWMMMWEWILFGFVWLGVRKRIRLRDLVGGRWATMEDVFLDIVYAGTFWIGVLFVLGATAKLMHLDQAGKIQSMREQLGFLAPGTNLELAAWFCLSCTAGFCEEVIFRGYLQRQFSVIGNSVLFGVIASAIVFGASHGYEGPMRMILIAIFGLLLGLLAWWRKSLRPGMIAHAWHDLLGGALLRFLR